MLLWELFIFFIRPQFRTQMESACVRNAQSANPKPAGICRISVSDLGQVLASKTPAFCSRFHFITSESVLPTSLIHFLATWNFLSGCAMTFPWGWCLLRAIVRKGLHDKEQSWLFLHISENA